MTAISFEPAFVERISGARPAEMTAMLLEAAIDCLKDAAAAVRAGQIEARFTASAKAMKIVGFLHEILDYEKGVEAFRVTDRLSDSDRATLMGGTLTRIYDWAPGKR